MKYAGHAGQVQHNFQLSDVDLKVNPIKCLVYKVKFE